MSVTGSGEQESSRREVDQVKTRVGIEQGSAIVKERNGERQMGLGNNRKIVVKNIQVQVSNNNAQVLYHMCRLSSKPYNNSHDSTYE